MKRSSAAHLNCSIARSLEILGEWWTLLILRDAFFGVRRFEDFVTDLEISRGILTDRLRTLVEHGILRRELYQRSPDRYEYRLTRQGLDLFPVLMALMRWGDRWLSTPVVGGPPLVVKHSDCGRDLLGEFRCAHCSAPVDATEVSLEAGPGSGPEDMLPSVSHSSD